MKNNKHIFAQHISEIGVKNPALKQNLNVINEMADGGTIYDFGIGDRGKYQTRSGLIDIEITNVTDKGWVIFKDNKGDRKDAKIDAFISKFTLSNPLNDSSTSVNAPIDNQPQTFNRLTEGETYNIDDFNIDDDAILRELKRFGNEVFKVYEIDIEGELFKIEKPTYNGNIFWEIKFYEISRKQTPQPNANDVTNNTNTIFGIGSKGKYETRSGIIDIEITNVTDKGWVIFKDDKGNRKDAKIDAFANKFTPSTQTFAIPPITTPIDIVPKESEINEVEEIKLQPKKQVTPKPIDEKLNFESAKQNFIQKNIIGESTIFTPKFVLLESLIELNELTKSTEQQMSSELQDAINNIDNYIDDSNFNDFIL
jgi:hypothetical protein